MTRIRTTNEIWSVNETYEEVLELIRSAMQYENDFIEVTRAEQALRKMSINRKHIISIFNP